jgi:hypothetical protein
MNINQIITQIKAGPNDISICPGVPESTLNWFERQVRIVMPEDFKVFYRFCNGFESEEDAFRIITLDEIVDEKFEKRRKGLDNKRFYFAEYMQYSDMWSIEMGITKEDTYTIFCPTRNNEQFILTHSFTEFLECFLANGVFGDNGLYNWGDEVAGNNHKD